ncbi:M56 family metallopeptidase [Persephonella sp.]
MTAGSVAFFYVAAFVVLYITAYLVILVNIPAWTADVKGCFSVMELEEFLLNHINVFLYITAFIFMSVYLVKAVLKTLQTAVKTKKTTDAVKNLKVKKYKNLIVIKSKDPLAFNILNNIVISTEVLKKLSKQEKKAVFYHEKGHLKNLDSYRYILVFFAVSLLPGKISKAVAKQIILSMELSADRYALRQVKAEELAEAVLKLKNHSSPLPAGTTFTTYRLEVVLGLKKENFPVLLMSVCTGVLIFITALLVYKNCFCGVMA